MVQRGHGPDGIRARPCSSRCWLVSSSEIVLAALPRRLLQCVCDAIEQGLPVPDVLQPNVRESRHRRARLLDDAGHVAARVRHDHTEPLVVLHLLGPDDSVGVDPVDERQVGLEYRVHEDDEHRGVHIGTRQVDRARRAVQRPLLHECRFDVVPFDDVPLDDVFEMSRDDDELVDVEPLHGIHHVVHDRSPGDPDERLGDPLGERQEARAFPGERDDDFHVTRARSGL